MQLWKLDYLYILYSSFAMQQGVHLMHALLTDLQMPVTMATILRYLARLA